MTLLDSPFHLPPGRLLALDVGDVRIGAASCDEAGILASPLALIRRHATRAQDFAEVESIALKKRAVGILIGLPMDGQGGLGRQARRIRRYAVRMAQVVSLPVAFWDESFSSIEAASLLRDAGSQGSLDAASAAVFLADFLEVRRVRQPGAEE